MKISSPYQFRLVDLLWALTLAAVVLVVSRAVGLSAAVLLGLVASLLTYAWTRRGHWLVLAVVQLILVPAIWCYQIFEVTTHSTYVKNYNYRMDALAKEADLVGADEDMVELKLGAATSVSKGWDQTDIETDMPTPNARFTTTYNYAPYPSFPYAKFQVHCEGGKVVATEMFDD